MTKYIYVIAAIGAAVLSIATIYLAWVNRGPKIYQPILSILFGAIIATFLTVATLLKPSKISERFPISIALSQKTGLPVIVPTHNNAARLQMEVASRAMAEEQGEVGIFAPRKVMFSAFQEKADFYSELLQYELVRNLFTILRTDFGIEQTFTDSNAVVKTEFIDAFRPDDFLKFYGNHIVSQLSSNRFLNLTERRMWNDTNSWLPFPLKAKLRVPDKQSLIIERPGYLKLVIKIEALGGAPGVPNHLASLIQEREVETLAFMVTCSATFERLTAESPETRDNKQWVESLLSYLKKRLENQ